MYTIAFFFMRLSNYLNELACRIRNGDVRAAVEGWAFLITLFATVIYLLIEIVKMCAPHL